MLLKPVTKEVIADTACGDVWVNWTYGQVSRTGVGGSNPGDTGLAVRSKPDPSPVLIVSPTISPYCGISGSLKVGKK